MAERSQIIDTAAGIVTYHPDLTRLQNNFNAVSGQVARVYCFDNGSSNIGEIRKLISRYDNFFLIENRKNAGIAAGLNKIIETARLDGFAWLLTLDQDSVCPAGMVETMLKNAVGADIAAICPVIVDRRRPPEKREKKDTEFTDFCITSGCLVNIGLSEEIGDFDSWLFIGQVDDEFCHRIMINDKKILKINSILLDHELGNLIPSRHRKLFLTVGKLLHSKMLLALSYRRKVSPMRVYYSTRNMVYLSRKYCDYPNPKFTKKRAIYNAFSNIIRGQKKLEIMRAAIKGYRDGSSAKVQVYMKEEGR